MDSDDEYERRPRGRDKFRRERSDYNERSGGRRDDRSSRRDDNNWSDRRRQVWGDSRRKDYRDFDRERRDSGGRHHDISPPMKKVRRDWDNSGYQQAEFTGYHPMPNQWMPPMEMQQHNVHQRQFENEQQVPTDMSGGPVMMTFKQFLNSMEDNIDDMEAVKKYQTYKVEFRKTQIADFFTAHKDEEWFRNKYHPNDALAYQRKLNRAIRKRAKVFIDLLQSDWIQKFTMTAGEGEDITKLLDAAVIKLEGGTDFDLQVLDRPIEEEEQRSTVATQEEQTTAGASESVPNKETSKQPDISPVSPSTVPLPDTPAPAKNEASKPENIIKPLELSDPSPDQLKLKEEAAKYHQQQQQETTTVEKTDNPPPENQQKRKRKRRHREPYYYDGNVESESESESDIESEPAPPGEETSHRDAQERAAEERLLPPGVEVEPVSAGEDTSKQADPTGEVKSVKDTEESSGVPVLTTEDAELADKKNEAEDKGTPVASGETVAPSVPSEQDMVHSSEQGGKDEDELEKAAPDTKHDEEEKSGSDEVGLPEDTSKEDETKPEDVDMEKGQATEDKLEVTGDNGEKRSDNSKPEPVVQEIKTPRPLHQTASLFVRNVPPKISHYDIETACYRFPGFMRVVLSDASPERKFSRRGWITFKPDVNIKDICWTINNMKIKDIELNPIVNRELARRVRTVSGAAVLKKIVETDIAIARKLIGHLDEKYRVWNAEEDLKKMKAEVAKKAEEPVEEIDSEINEETSSAQPSEDSKPVIQEVEEEELVTLPKSNPLLEPLPAKPSDATSENTTDTAAKTGNEEGQLDEEGQVADEGELPADEVKTSEIVSPDIDGELIRILDRLVLYLRVVHSLDYYNGAEYLYEDDMPNRCGIVHIRNSLPEKINYEEVNEWHKNLQTKLEQHLKKTERLPDEEASQLGKKVPGQETEKFVIANTQELAKDKWLCPLSGKKFRGPEFVKKHIFNKHGDKVEGVKTEVAFFNNFVYDPNRPCVPDAKQFHAGGPHQGYQGGAQFQMGMQANMGWGRGMMQQGRGGFMPNLSSNFRSGPDNFNNRGQSFQMKPKRGSMRRDPRQIVQYRDLDAPGDEMDFL